MHCALLHPEDASNHLLQGHSDVFGRVTYSEGDLVGTDASETIGGLHVLEDNGDAAATLLGANAGRDWAIRHAVVGGGV